MGAPPAARVMRPVELGVPVIDAPFHRLTGRRIAGRQVQLAGQPANVSRIGQDPGDEHLWCRNVGAVLARATGTRVAPGQKRRAAWRAHWALRKGMLEQCARLSEAIEVGRAYKSVPIAAQGVKTLLIRTDP